jgi:hypothetical protein
MHTKSSSRGVIEFQGTKLPHLTEESVIQYQSACINLLIDASANAEEFADGDILSAITILRFQEQTDGESLDLCPLPRLRLPACTNLSEPSTIN